jgi:phosphopantothenoylcysteine synthetase/decarboxylase
VVANARGKLAAKKLDFIVANDMSAFESDTNRVTVLSATASTELAGSKREVAAQIWDIVQGRVK